MERVVESLVQDFRYASRVLAARPIWTAAALACLAIATGANTAAFTLVNGLLLRPLPFDHSEELAMVALQESRADTTRPFSLAEYHDIAEAGGGLGELLAWTFEDVSVVDQDGVAMAEAQLVSDNYFATLHVSPLIGQFLDTRAERAGQSVAVLSHEFWRRRFHADREVVGRQLHVDGLPVTVVGIAPDGFVGAMHLIRTDLWLPSSLYATLKRSSEATRVPAFGVLGRFPAWVGFDRARAGLTAIVAALASTADAESPPTVVVTPARGFGVPPAARGTALGVSGFAFVLMALLTIVAAANVAALVLARGVGRSRDIGVRLALGASRLRLATQLAAESLELALAGSAIGAVAGIWLTEALVTRVSTPFSYVSYAVNVRPDATVIAAAALMATATTVLCGLAPIRHVWRLDPRDVLKSSSGGTGRRTTRTLNGIVAAQFTVSTTLMITAGLFARAYLNTGVVDPGFETRHLVSVPLDLTTVDMDEPTGRGFYDDLVEHLSAIPGVDHVTLSSQMPFATDPPSATITPGGTAGPAADSFSAGQVIAGPRYFETLGLRRLEGRPFRRTESVQPPIAVVNATLARRLAPTGSAVGRTFDVNRRDRLEVVGVVADAKYRSLTEPERPLFYRPFSQAYSPVMTVLVRTIAPPEPLFESIAAVIRSLAPDLAVSEIWTVSQQIDSTRAGRRAIATLLLVIGGLGLLLSAIGLYGVVWYGVRQRARELGVRLALGARPADVRRLVVATGLKVVLTGGLVGLIASLGLARIVRSALFGVEPGDPLTVTTVAGILLVSALVALSVPARWASRVDPAETLRCE